MTDMSSDSPIVALEQLLISTNRHVLNFPDLPTELREKIYKSYMKIIRVVTVLPNAATRKHKTFTRAPVLLFICRESRHFALRRLVNIFPSSQNPVYVNPEVDMVLLSTYRSPAVRTRRFEGLDLSKVKSLAILQEDMGLASANIDAHWIEASCLVPFENVANNVANPGAHIPQPKWRMGSIDVIDTLIDVLEQNSGSEVQELVVLVMPPNTKKWSPTELDITIRKCLIPRSSSTSFSLIEKLREMDTWGPDPQPGESVFPHYLVTAEPIATSESIRAIHGYSPALQDGLGFHHAWKRVDLHPNFKSSYFGLRLYKAPTMCGNMATEGAHWPVPGRNSKHFIRIMPLEWETMFQHAILHNLEPPLVVDFLLILKAHSRARYLSNDGQRFMDLSYLNPRTILARLYNGIDPFLQVNFR